MQELRLQLAAARDTLRSAKDAHEFARAEREQRAVDAGEAGGKNAEERARSLTLALAKDESYRAALANMRAAEAEVDRLDALLEGARDARRHDEWRTRARLADALLGVPIEPESDEHDALMERIGDETTGEIIAQHYPDHMSGGSLDSDFYAGKRRPQPTYATFADEDLPF